MFVLPSPFSLPLPVCSPLLFTFTSCASLIRFLSFSFTQETCVLFEGEERKTCSLSPSPSPPLSPSLPYSFELDEKLRERNTKLLWLTRKNFSTKSREGTRLTLLLVLLLALLLSSSSSFLPSFFNFPSLLIFFPEYHKKTGLAN
jgi:hypothetical protein